MAVAVGRLRQLMSSAGASDGPIDKARIPAAAAHRWRGRCRPSLSAPVSAPANAPPEAGRFAPNITLPMTRRVISMAARRENVISRMRRRSTPLAARCTTRWASVLVLPDPAPAITRRPAPSASTGPRSRDRRPVGRHVLDGAALVGVELVEIAADIGESLFSENRKGVSGVPAIAEEAKQDEPCPMFVRNRGDAGRVARMSAATCDGNTSAPLQTPPRRSRQSNRTSRMSLRSSGLRVRCGPPLRTPRRAPAPRPARRARRRPIPSSRASP
jgi:hypothetical protein